MPTEVRAGRVPMIAVENLTKAYGQGKPALKGISLTIDRGEFAVIFGPSGVGKSTLLRCLNHLITPTSGAVAVHGRALADLSVAELLRVRSQIGMIFQDFNLIGRMSALVNVMCGRLHGLGFLRALTYSFSHEDHARAIVALRRAGLDDEELYHRRADTLSGGQRQRVAIARALVQEPKIILADEPVASLDVKMQHTILQLIAEIAARDGITVVMSLHQLDLAKRYATRIVGLSDGEVVFDGPPGSLNDEIINKVFKIVDGTIMAANA